MKLNISQKAIHMPESPIRKLMPSAEIAEKKGKKVFYLNIGQPDIQSPKPAIEALKKWENPILAYTKSAGTYEYREAVATYFKNRGCDISGRDVLATNGASEALLFVFSAIAEVGYEIVVPEPFYANYIGFAHQSDVNFMPVTSRIDNGFALPSIDLFEEKITHKTKAILICNPGNPTGNLYSKKDLEKLRDLCIKHNLYLISDEVYREFTYDEEHTSILSFPELAEHAIVIESESKRFSMCGIRLGTIVSKNHRLLDYVLRFAQARLCPSVISQKIATKAYEDCSCYLGNAKKEYEKRRDFMVKRLNEMPGVFCPKPQGAFYCAVRLPVDDAEEFVKWMLEDFEYEGNTLMLAPLQGFYFTANKGKNEARIAYVLNVEDLKKAMDTLEEALKVYPNNTLNHK